MAHLELHDLHKRYGSVAALDGVSLQVPAGSRAAIVGASGSGKTTLLRVIAGFEAPDAGRVTLAGELLADGPSIVPAHQRGIGFVPQDGALFPHLSVADNVGFGLPRNLPGRGERIAELMDMVSLERSMLARRPHQLSGGQQQRVALARALAQRPRLILLDEPFSALDTGLRAATRKAVARLLETAGITTILVTHDQAEALSFADQVAVVRAGRIAQAGAPLDLYLRPVDAATARFLGEAVVLPARVDMGWAHCALGRVPVPAGAASGAAQILLRPEQLRCTAAPAPAAHNGEVLEVDFTGPECLLTVRVGAGAEAPTLSVRSTGLQAPRVGAQVAITVDGPAHVLPH